MARANADVGVIFEVHPNCQNRRDNLTDDRGKRRGNYETITGSISWNDSNDIVATDPTMKQGVS